MTINYSESRKIDANKIKTLYDDVKWTVYTQDMPKLIKAINGSLNVINA